MSTFEPTVKCHCDGRMDGENCRTEPINVLMIKSGENYHLTGEELQTVLKWDHNWITKNGYHYCPACDKEITIKLRKYRCRNCGTPALEYAICSRCHEEA